MLARLAEDLYWAGRYLERLQHTARVLDITTESFFTVPTPEQGDLWQLALAMLRLESPYRERHGPPDSASAVSFCVTDTQHAGSLASLVRSLRENVHRIRELVSSELWEAVNDLFLRFDTRNVARQLDAHPAEVYAFVKSSAHAIVGVASETLSRDDTARLFELGIHVERAGSTTRVLGTQAAVLDASDRIGLEYWAPLLRICAAREAFVRSGLTATSDGVTSLLMFSSVFPRSVRFSVTSADNHVRALLGESTTDSTSAVPGQQPLIVRHLGLLRSRLDFGDVGEVLATGLAQTASAFETEFHSVHQAIAARFFHHASDLAFQLQEIRSLGGEAGGPGR